MLAARIDYAVPATPDQISEAVNAVQARGIQVIVVDTPAEALAQVTELIPAGSTIMTGGSQTLRDIGLEDKLVAKAHPWVNLKDEVLAETDPAKQREARRQTILAPYFLGSVQAIAQTGEIVVASASGSQLPSYAFSSQNVIWVAGVQKIVPTLDDALRRVREYSLPLEHERMQKLGYPGSVLAKILIIEQEPPMLGRKITLILVNKPVGA